MASLVAIVVEALATMRGGGVGDGGVVVAPVRSRAEAGLASILAADHVL
jgi:hypothetical protein